MKRINQDIKTGQFNHIYLLYGTESYLRRTFKDKLKSAIIGDDTMNYQYYEGKDISVGAIIEQAETMPFFADKRLLVIENSGLFKANGDELAKYLNDMPSSTYIIFVEAQVDKRNKLYKTVQNLGYISELVTQPEQTLKAWIGKMVKEEGKQISQETLSYLLECLGTDMDFIQMEMEKLFCYCIQKDSITKADIDEVCTKVITNHIFDMINAISEHKQDKALLLYGELQALREPALRILSLMIRQYNLLIQIKELTQKGYRKDKIGIKTGLKDFIAGKYMQQSARFQMTELRQSLEDCLLTDEGIKTGRMTDSLSLELLIVKLSQKNN